MQVMSVAHKITQTIFFFLEILPLLQVKNVRVSLISINVVAKIFARLL